MRRTCSLLPLLALTVVAGCGGGGAEPTPVPTPTPTPVPPAIAMQATGNGALVLHPSIGTTFAVAMETPIEIRETAGGTADWNFARFSIFLRGVEIERGEIGSAEISTAGYSRISPNSTITPNPVFRFNSGNFDNLRITLGFGDVNRGGTVEVDVPFDSFSGVQVSAVPLVTAPGQVDWQP